MTTLYKRYVDVDVRMTKKGEIIPLAVYWYNGKSEPDRYEIGKVTEKPQVSASRVGGVGMRYVVEIHGQQRTLFFERNEETGMCRWFMESHQP